MHPHNRSVDYLHRSIMGGSQDVHDSGPHASPSPANETVVAGGVRTELIGHVAPRRSGAQHPEDAIEDTPVVTRGTPRGLFGSISLIAAHSWSVSS
jgi:hypothetical protein